MKTHKKITFLICCITLCSFFSSFAQQTHVITLHVSESGTFSFTADANTTVLDNSSPEAFSILVFEDDEVEWIGLAATGETVSIDKIKFPRNHKPFKSKTLDGKKNGNGKKVAKGKIAKNKKDKKFKYVIDFTVGDKAHSIDPEIKVGK